MGNKPNYSKYSTPINEPKSVKYWDRELIRTDLWTDWTILKSVLKLQIPDIMKELDIGKKEATQILWSAFVEATCGDEASPCREAYKNFVRGIDGYHFAYWTPRLTIGSDIHDGISEQDALRRYQNWLNSDPSNPIFGKYKVLENLDIVEMKRRKKRSR